MASAGTKHAFFADAAKAAAAETVAEVEAQTAAELVVAVRHHSGDYRASDYLAGFGLAMVTLCVLLFAPQHFNYFFFPVDLLLAFVLGVAVCRHLQPLRRLLTASRWMDEEVLRSARAAFVTQGISRTSGRTGILIYVSAFERRVQVVADVGVDLSLLGEDWLAIQHRLQEAVAGAPDPEAFFAALRALGPHLGKILPRAADDRNELPDCVDAA